MDYIEKSFASASDASKLLITLSTGVIAFCVAVINVKDADKTILTPISSIDRWSLAICWIAFAGAVGFGFWTQLAITHVLSLGTDAAPANPWSKKITVPFILQIAAFSVGVFLLVVYGVRRVLF